MLTVAGCSSHVDRLRQVRVSFYSGELAEAARLLDEQREAAAHDADVLALDQAMVELVRGRPQEAERLLREVRDRFDYLEQLDLAEQLLAAVRDDRQVAYAGEDYEKLLIRAVLALASLFGDGTDAFAYAMQTSSKQRQIIQAGLEHVEGNPKRGYKMVTLGPYLLGLLYETTGMDYDAAERQYLRVREWAPEFQSVQADLQRVRTGTHSRPGHGVLYVFALLDRGPYKEQAVEMPTSTALLIADRLLSAIGPYTLPPTVAPVLVPRVVTPPSRTRAVQVLVDGTSEARTETIADIGRMAVEQYEAIYDYVVARAVVRRVLKKGMIVGAKAVLETEESPWLDAALTLAGVVWEASEQADTRCWGLLPAKVQVARLELPAGRHRVSLRPVGPAVAQAASATVTVTEGRNSYVLAYFADGRLIGKVLVRDESQLMPDLQHAQR
jgi:hypothetical protein